MKKALLVNLLNAAEGWSPTVHPYHVQTTQVDWSNWGVTYGYDDYSNYVDNNQYANNDWWQEGNHYGGHAQPATTQFREIYATTDSPNWNNNQRPDRVEKVTSFDMFGGTTASPEKIQENWFNPNFGTTPDYNILSTAAPLVPWVYSTQADVLPIDVTTPPDFPAALFTTEDPFNKPETTEGIPDFMLTTQGLPLPETTESVLFPYAMFTTESAGNPSYTTDSMNVLPEVTSDTNYFGLFMETTEGIDLKTNFTTPSLPLFETTPEMNLETTDSLLDDFIFALHTTEESLMPLATTDVPLIQTTDIPLQTTLDYLFLKAMFTTAVPEAAPEDVFNDINWKDMDEDALLRLWSKHMNTGKTDSVEKKGFPVVNENDDFVNIGVTMIPIGDRDDDGALHALPKLVTTPDWRSTTSTTSTTTTTTTTTTEPVTTTTILPTTTISTTTSVETTTTLWLPELEPTTTASTTTLPNIPSTMSTVSVVNWETESPIQTTTTVTEIDNNKPSVVDHFWNILNAYETTQQEKSTTGLKTTSSTTSMTTTTTTTTTFRSTTIQLSSTTTSATTTSTSTTLSTTTFTTTRSTTTTSTTTTSTTTTSTTTTSTTTTSTTTTSTTSTSTSKTSTATTTTQQITSKSTTKSRKENTKPSKKKGKPVEDEHVKTTVQSKTLNETTIDVFSINPKILRKEPNSTTRQTISHMLLLITFCLSSWLLL